MNNLNLYQEFQYGQNENIIFELKGLISQDILVGFVELIKDKIFFKSQKNLITRKIFSIFIELFQNIVKHSACEINQFYKKEGIGDGIIILKSNGKHYTISSGNYIKKENIAKLTYIIDKINSLDKQELKKFYKECLKKNRTRNNNNSGVGLIDIARKSENSIEYNIISVSKALSFCEIHIKINK